ncbi:hypothetical protein UFOVP536_26 [uncultured Caudovirales phage]|uniref:Uncharacterized protein n=1 Tax=uncultured Caudovirales phage TaxID=2100421 RepID=A0A6J5MQT1_9CAUD|nr:hypothetical protein UFOVP536_26 [uncultured Caudovirales phage]
MATTTNFGIYYPVQTDSVAPLHTAFSTLANSVESALTTNLKPLSDNNKAYLYKVVSVAEMAALTSPPKGSFCFVDATDAEYYYDGSAWQLLYQPWTDYPSTITNANLLTTNGSVAITGGAYTINTAKYLVVGKMAHVQIQLTFHATVAPVFTSGLCVALPLTSINPTSSQMAQIGVAHLTKGTEYYPLTVHHTNTAYAKVRYMGNTAASAVILRMYDMTSAAPVAVAAANVMTFNFSYPLL